MHSVVGRPRLSGPASRGAYPDAHPAQGVAAVRTTDLVRSTAFYVALGWELSAASTAAMSLFKTAGSLLLVCTDELLAELGGHEGRPAGQLTGEAILPIHVATDAGVDAALQEAARAGGVVVKWLLPPRWAGPHGFFADPDGHLWEVIHHPLFQLGTDGRPEILWRVGPGPRADEAVLVGVLVPEDPRRS